MRILFILNRYPGYAGIEIVTTNLCNYLCKKVQWVGIYSFQQQAEEKLLSTLDKSVSFHKAIIYKGYSNPANLSQIYNICSKEKVNLVIYQDSYTQNFGSICSVLKKLPIRIVLVEHNMPDAGITKKNIKEIISQPSKKSNIRKVLAYYKGRFITHYYHIQKYLLTDGYVLLSNTYIPTLKQLVPFAGSKIKCIGNPVCIDTQNIDLTNKKKICLFCGRLEEQKGILHLMSIWEKVEKTGSDWILKIVGDGSQRSIIENFIKEHNLKNVVIEGYKVNTISYYQEASIFLMTSLYEGYPLTLLEAKACGCVPIVFDSFSAIKDIIQDKKDGIIVKSFEDNLFYCELMQIINNPLILKNMSTNCLEDINRFSIERIGEEWLSYLKSLNVE